ncbi:hypothetical protein [Rhizobium leguminosarum]
MSGGGKIIEKRPMTLSDGKEVIRYHVISQYRPDWFDETYVCAEPADDEPKLGEEIWWGGDKTIWFGPNDSKSLVKVGYSFTPKGDAA